MGKISLVDRVVNIHPKKPLGEEVLRFIHGVKIKSEMERVMKSKNIFIAIVFLFTIVFFQNKALAHCDTIDGPVVKAAKIALEKGDVTPVLKWIKKENEAEIRSAFGRTLLVRSKGREEKELADIYFFETLVRLHRAGEGEPYTGLKPAGTPIEPIVATADKSLEIGDLKELSHTLSETIEAGLAMRLKRALEAKSDADKNVDAGREYVEAYVAYVHYAEHVKKIAESGGHHGESTENH
jgi:hypothetical protein